jgi:uncharacterized UBP type Zn finger protein
MKDMRKLEIEETIPVSAFSLQKEEGPKALRFHLSVVVCHVGAQVECGHYYVLGRKIDSRSPVWVCISDDRVENADLEDAAKNAYALLYTLER